MAGQRGDEEERLDGPGADALDLRRLRYFVAVAEEMHFGRAADRLGMAQPPLSRQIARLEAAVQAQLIDRSRSRIQLTQAGELMLGRARKLLRDVEDVRQEIGRLGSGKAGVLRIAFVGSATHGSLPTLIGDFRAEHPSIELVLSAMNNAGLKQLLVERQIDVAIARPSIDDADIVSERLEQEPLILALPDALAGDPGQEIELAALRDETFVLYPASPRPSFADHVLRVCEAAGFQPRDMVMASDYQTAVSLVAVGAGVCIVPRSVSSTHRPGITYRSYLGPNPGTALSVNYRIDNRSPQLWSFLKAARLQARRIGGEKADG